MKKKDLMYTSEHKAHITMIEEDRYGLSWKVPAPPDWRANEVLRGCSEDRWITFD
jgi:hypothetical protein